MSSASPPVTPQLNTGELPQSQALRVLSILWYIYAGLLLLAMCFGGLYLALGITAFTNPDFFESSNPDEPPPELFAWMFTVIGGCFMLLAVVVGVLALLTARGLSRRGNFGLCLVTSAIVCLNVPLGTALGVYTIITLYSRGVKESFTSDAPEFR